MQSSFSYSACFGFFMLPTTLSPLVSPSPLSTLCISRLFPMFTAFILVFFSPGDHCLHVLTAPFPLPSASPLSSSLLHYRHSHQLSSVPHKHHLCYHQLPLHTIIFFGCSPSSSQGGHFLDRPLLLLMIPHHRQR